MYASSKLRVPQGSKANVHSQVWDNTCATWMMGFQSFRVHTYGGSGQHLHAYSRNACVAPTVGGYSGAYIDGRQEGAALVKEVRDREDVDAAVLNYPCYETTNADGGANALASWSY